MLSPARHYGLDNLQSLSAVTPETNEQDPEEAISDTKPRAFVPAFHDG